MSNGPRIGPFTPGQAQVLGIPVRTAPHDCDTRFACPHQPAQTVPTGSDTQTHPDRAAEPPRADLAGARAIPAEAVARAFHEAYERLAPSFGYETRKASAVPWDQVPENNQRLMTAVAAEVAPLIVADAVREVLGLPLLAALRCIPDGEIRNGCVVNDGAKVRERVRLAYLALTRPAPAVHYPECPHGWCS